MQNTLLAIREGLHIKRRQVAHAVGVDWSTYYRWEMEGAPFSMAHLVKLAKFFDVTPLEICPWFADSLQDDQPVLAATVEEID
jgi:DNA-binding XRE family transcriptional regulator